VVAGASHGPVVKSCWSASSLLTPRALVQLITDKSGTAAHRFYERLGFAASDEGTKLSL
jgi:hypothetical protein